MQRVAELLQVPPVSKVVYLYLDSVLPEPAVGRIPDPRPAAFIRIRSGGGSDVDVAAAQPTVFVESYAQKIEDAEDLALRADAWLMKASLEGWLGAYAIRTIDTISRPQELPDPVTSIPRFTATYAPILKRVAVTVP